MNKNKVKIELVGKSADGVTGSMYLISFNDKQILLDAGLYQTSSDDIRKQYLVNHRNYHVPFAKLDCIILSHVHIDHCGIIPYVFAKGYRGNIYVPEGSTELLKIMWEDSLKIFESDCVKLEHRYDMKAVPLYTQEDIDMALSNIVEIPFRNEMVVFDDLTLCYYHASHIVNAAQVRLRFQVGNVSKTLNYTGDIGSDINKDYLLPYDKLPYADIVLGECTYGGSHKKHGQKDRDKDIEKIKCVVEQCCLDNNNKVLFGVFSLQRLQDILTTLYKLYGKDESFTTQVILDAPLGKKISDVWHNVIEKDCELWKEVIAWKNIKWVETYEESTQLRKENSSQIIISTSNFLKNGRVVEWLKSMLPNSNNRIFLCGYAGDETSIAYQIQHNKKYVEIDGVKVKNGANVISLNSFSSHASQDELLKRYSEMQFNKIYLVHSESKGKQVFAEKLRDVLSKNNRSSKVGLTAMGDEIKF